MFVTTTAGACLAGLVAGTLHALLGPDHLAAVAPLSMGREIRPWLAGITWGWGHAIGTWAVAAIALLGWQLLPVAPFAAVSERLVGVVLIGLGLWGFRSLHRNRVHTHLHQHQGGPHVHFHAHGEATGADHGETPHRGHNHAGFGIGVLHGFAGSGPFLAVLPAIVLVSGSAKLAYVVCYGIGAMVAMSGFAWMVGRLADRARERSKQAYRSLLATGSSVSVTVGIAWLVV